MEEFTDSTWALLMDTRDANMREFWKSIEHAGIPREKAMAFLNEAWSVIVFQESGMQTIRDVADSIREEDSFRAHLDQWNAEHPARKVAPPPPPKTSIPDSWKAEYDRYRLAGSSNKKCPGNELSLYLSELAVQVFGIPVHSAVSNLVSAVTGKVIDVSVSRHRARKRLESR
ncbi:MAG TPA: hypothetical protein VI457_15790 [Methylococcaceae bacterium]|nr:hypothetical protein [Methylococcaceae bacterium]